MMKNCVRLLIILFTNDLSAQIFLSQSSDFIINQGAQVISNGGIEIFSGSIVNNGFIQVSRNSTLPNSGNFYLNPSSLVTGNGYYKIEQNWVNDGVFNCEQSTVELYGNFKQIITSSNNVNTLFHNLVLSGLGTNDNRKKELQGVNVFTDYTGELFLNDRELSTLSNSFYVMNPVNSCIHFDQNFQDEGFVSSLYPGFLWRSTNNTSAYIFPVGSSDGTRRFRPIELSPKDQIENDFGARLNNYNSDDDSYNRSSTDGLSKELNPYFYHSIKGEEVNASTADLNIGYLISDGIFLGIANWNLNKWLSFSNEVPKSIGNYNSLGQNDVDFFNLSHPYILSNNDIASDVYVPNTFTPDGQEFNNVFFPVFSDNNSFSQIELLIFNRWGELIYTGYGYDCGWDGYYSYLKCQDGIYTWKLNYSKGDIKKTIVGHVNLIK